MRHLLQVAREETRLHRWPDSLHSLRGQRLPLLQRLVVVPHLHLAEPVAAVFLPQWSQREYFLLLFTLKRDYS